MKIAFVGVKRKYQELNKGYSYFFDRFHLEIPWYYSYYGENDVTLTTVDQNDNDSVLRHQTEKTFITAKEKYDVVIHWRKWFPELYVDGAINLLHTCDHSYSSEWKDAVVGAANRKELSGILCYKTWHERQLKQEIPLPPEMFYSGYTFGVDTNVYDPAENKDPHQMLWASDPGRGLLLATQLAIMMYQFDKEFKLNVCYPDYVNGVSRIKHPAIRYYDNVSNGQVLWSLFNVCGILPYTSTFKEPSSRAYRQAQAAGSLVLYPPNMGTPSEVINNFRDGVVAGIHEWPKLILENVNNGNWKKIGKNARDLAVSEDWKVQATRFNKLIADWR
jgi:hypothetical protein